MKAAVQKGNGLAPAREKHGKAAGNNTGNETIKESGSYSGKEIEKDTKKRGRGYLLEALLIRASIIALSILVVSQAVLSIPSVRAAFFSEGTDGNPLGSETYAYIPCRMELSLTNMDECPELKILVNGETTEIFQGKSVLLDLKNGDVVELDASEVLVLPVVQISAASRNVEALLGKTINASGGIVPVATMKTGN